MKKQRRCKFCKRPLTENNLTEFCCNTCYQSDIQMNLMMLTEINNHSVGPTSAASSAGGGDRKRKDRGPIQLKVEYDGATQFAFKFKLPSTSSVDIFDGDGTKTTIVGQDDTEVTHTTAYAAPGTYYFYVEGDYLDITYIDIRGITFVGGDVTRWSELVNLTFIHIWRTAATGDITGFSALTSLVYINIGECEQLIGDISGLSSIITLEKIVSFSNTSTNLLECNIESFVNHPSLNWLQIMHSPGCCGDLSKLCDLGLTVVLGESNTTFDEICVWSATGNFLMRNCNWTSAMVDNALISLANGNISGVYIWLDGTNAPRTAASDAAFAYLDANNTLEVNPPE